MYDVFVRYAALPVCVRGVTLPIEDGRFDIYLNNRLCENAQRAALEHELQHIRENHFYDCDPVVINEKRAQTG